MLCAFEYLKINIIQTKTKYSWDSVYLFQLMAWKFYYGDGAPTCSKNIWMKDNSLFQVEHEKLVTHISSFE